MKQIACIFGTVLLFLTASAQDTKVGIKAGSNQSTMNFSLSGVSKETDPRISFHAGFYATIMTSKKFGIQPELMYSGWRYFLNGKYQPLVPECSPHVSV